MTSSPQFSLVLGGGGLKGLAHIGVLRALEEQGLEPEAVVGCSIGALIAGAWATGMPIDEMEERALAIRRHDVFRIAHLDMALKRMLAPAIYRPEPLDTLIQSLVGDATFDQLPRKLVVNTVDLNTGQQLLWGLPGLKDARVADAVFASCALPGIWPPRPINGRVCVDGAVIENLPVRAALVLSTGPILAVDVGGAGAIRPGIERHGFAATYTRGLEIVMQTLAEELLRDWETPPVILIRPKVERISMFAFNRTPFLIAEGYRSLNQALARLPNTLDRLPSGIHPQHEVALSVDPVRCVGCGVCVAQAPATFEWGPGHKARVRAARQRWSPLGGRIVSACPTNAITAVTTARAVR